jgi:hypothetical protein
MGAFEVITRISVPAYFFQSNAMDGLTKKQRRNTTANASISSLSILFFRIMVFLLSIGGLQKFTENNLRHIMVGLVFSVPNS